MHLMPQDEQKHCPLFKLPPELRNRIYSYATSQSEAKKKPSTSRLPLGTSNHLTYYYDPSSNYKDHHTLPVVSLNQISNVKPSNAMLGTCQRIYQEARGIFVEAQRTFWKTNAILFDIHDDWTDGLPTAQEIVARLHARQIDSMPKFSVTMTVRGCLHTFHFIEDDLEMTDDEINDGYAPNCGFCHGGCSHTGELSHAELKLMCDDLGHDLLFSAVVNGPFLRAHDMKRYSAKARARIAEYEKSAKAYLCIATRDRESSKREDHAVLRWEEERLGFLQKLESKDVNMKRMMLTAVVQHFCDLYLSDVGPHS